MFGRFTMLDKLANNWGKQYCLLGSTRDRSNCDSENRQDPTMFKQVLHRLCENYFFLQSVVLLEQIETCGRYLTLQAPFVVHVELESGRTLLVRVICNVGRLVTFVLKKYLQDYASISSYRCCESNYSTFALPHTTFEREKCFHIRN